VAGSRSASLVRIPFACRCAIDVTLKPRLGTPVPTIAQLNKQREALERIRQEQERRRVVEESARKAGETARVAAEAARDAAMSAVHAAVENATAAARVVQREGPGPKAPAVAGRRRIDGVRCTCASMLVHLREPITDDSLVGRPVDPFTGPCPATARSWRPSRSARLRARRAPPGRQPRRECFGPFA